MEIHKCQRLLRGTNTKLGGRAGREYLRGLQASPCCGTHTSTGGPSRYLLDLLSIEEPLRKFYFYRIGGWALNSPPYVLLVGEVGSGEL